MCFIPIKSEIKCEKSKKLSIITRKKVTKNVQRSYGKATSFVYTVCKCTLFPTRYKCHKTFEAIQVTAVVVGQWLLIQLISNIFSRTLSRMLWIAGITFFHLLSGSTVRSEMADEQKKRDGKRTFYWNVKIIMAFCT